jgi:hypothetical protein
VTQLVTRKQALTLALIVLVTVPFIISGQNKLVAIGSGLMVVTGYLLGQYWQERSARKTAVVLGLAAVAAICWGASGWSSSLTGALSAVAFFTIVLAARLMAVRARAN